MTIEALLHYYRVHSHEVLAMRSMGSIRLLHMISMSSSGSQFDGFNFVFNYFFIFGFINAAPRNALLNIIYAYISIG